MCGIAGFVGPFGDALLPQMSALIASRGPDDAGQWHDRTAGIGLCHRRLSVIDVSPLGRQPMWDAEGRAAIVFNGEIYNFADLRRGLERDGVRFASRTDTEVLLNLYLRDGVAMLPRLNGMFAFAIWDRRTATLFAARDAAGVKPFYYAETPKGFVFASEMKALVCEPSVATGINLPALLQSLTLLYTMAPNTMLAGIAKLEPGHALVVKRGAAATKWAWSEPPWLTPKVQLSDAAATAMLRDKLDRATRRQMTADVPVGAFLSGGLDSSALVALARTHARDRNLPCFTIAFRDDAWRREGMVDDLPYSRLVAKHLEVPLEVIEVGAEMLDGLEDMIFRLDEPNADLSGLHVRAISRQARASGIKVLLSGAGGDDLFAGYRRHQALQSEAYWAWLPHPIRAMAAAAARGSGVATATKRRLVKAFRHADLGQDERLASYAEWIDPLSRNHLLSSDVRHALLDGLADRPLLSSLRELPPGLTPLDRMLSLDQRHFLADHNLNYTDKMSMAEGLEVRVPFLDPDVVAFSWSLPDQLKYRRGRGKWVLAEAMRGLLPPEVLSRPKTGFGIPLRRWLHHELNDHLHQYLSDSRVRARGLFDAAGVRRLIALDRAGQIDGAYTILSLLCVEIWCSLFLDGGWRHHVDAAAPQAV